MSKNMDRPNQNSRWPQPKESGQNPKILASQDSIDATEEKWGTHKI
jgi:hypothetical protein